MPAECATAISNRLAAIAASLRVEGETRTLAQLGADVLADLLIDGEISADHGGAGIGRGIRAQVNVSVPVLSLLGSSEEPAALEGYGLIDPQTARTLSAHAPSFRRILTHPESGAVLSVGRESYAVPADLRAWLRVRDETCRFPGCGRAAIRCDIDHTIDWQHGGSTRHDNLAHVCEGHHNLKHQTEWSVVQRHNGILEWTSPSGRTYLTLPATEMVA